MRAVGAAGCLCGIVGGAGRVQGDTYNYIGKSSSSGQTSNSWNVAASWTNGSGAFPNAPGDVARSTSYVSGDVALYLNQNTTNGVLNWSGDTLYLRAFRPLKLYVNNAGVPAVWNITAGYTFYLDPDVVLIDDLTLRVTNSIGFSSGRFDAVRIGGTLSGPGRLTIETPVRGLNPVGIGSVGAAANTYSGGTRLVGQVPSGTIFEPRMNGVFGTGNLELSPGARIVLRKRYATNDYIANPAALRLESVAVTNRANVYLENGVNEIVGSLYLDNVQQPAATYGAAGSGAAELLDEFLAGPGWLTVTSGPPNPGSIANLPASGIQPPNATLRGTLLAANATPTSVYLYWGLADGGRQRDAWAHEVPLGELAPGEFSSVIAGISAGQTVYYRCYLTNALGGKWASDTAKICPPVLRNELPMVRTNQITLRGTLLTTNGLPTAVTVFWGAGDGGTNAGNWANALSLGVAAAGPLATNVSGLPFNTTFYYRFYGTNESGAGWAANSQVFVTVAPPAYGDITFVVGSDTHYGFTAHVPTCAEVCSVALDNMNLVPGRVYPASVGGGPVGFPRGLLLVGDPTENGLASEWSAFTNDWGLNGERRLSFPIYEGFGNHDTAVVHEEIKKRNLLRAGIGNRSANGYHYSWDWDFLHVVCLNVFPGNEIDAGYLAIDPKASLQFLAADLAANVGESGHPVVIYHHYGLDAFGAAAWSPRQRTNYFNVIKSYNVIGIFSGHSHTREYLSWQGLNAFTDGTVGKFLGSFLVVRVTQTNMVVVENTVSNVWGAGFQKSISVPTAPVLVGLTLTNGFWSMDVWGQPGPGYTMETSADLSDWSDLGSTSMLGMKFTWTDTNAPDAGPRFYRVRRQP